MRLLLEIALLNQNKSVIENIDIFVKEYQTIFPNSKGRGHGISLPRQLLN